MISSRKTTLTYSADDLKELLTDMASKEYPNKDIIVKFKVQPVCTGWGMQERDELKFTGVDIEITDKRTEY
ncbi:MAG: hypothetical protein WC679_01235 [Bacteroidales bacterium]|jgi:hypothetical protein